MILAKFSNINNPPAHAFKTIHMIHKFKCMGGRFVYVRKLGQNHVKIANFYRVPPVKLKILHVKAHKENGNFEFREKRRLQDF